MINMQALYLEFGIAMEVLKICGGDLSIGSDRRYFAALQTAKAAKLRIWNAENTCDTSSVTNEHIQKAAINA